MPRLVRTGGTASMADGQEVMGVADCILLGQRRAAAAAVAAGGEGKDIDLTLIAADADASRGSVDPAFPAHIGPIKMWAEAVWEQTFPLSSMGIAITRARCRLVRARRMWAAVQALAVAVLATAARIEWEFVSAAVIRRHDGGTIDLTLDSPAAVASHVRRAVERWRWRRLEARYPHLAGGGGGHGANALPILRLLATNLPDYSWGPAQRAMLRSAWVNGQWPQARLAAAKLTDDGYCQMCKAAAEATHGDEHDDDEGMLDADTMHDHHGARPGPTIPRGTLFHRYHECSHVYAECRRRLLQAGAHTVINGIDEVRRQAREAADAEAAGGGPMVMPAWTRAVVPSPMSQLPPPSRDGTFTWHRQPDEQRVDGWAYVDASGLDGPRAPLMRIGWSFAVFGQHGDLLAAAYGAVLDWVMSVAAGGAYALMQVIDVMMLGGWYL